MATNPRSGSLSSTIGFSSLRPVKRPAVAFDQIGAPCIGMLNAGVDAVPKRDASRECEARDQGQDILCAGRWALGWLV
jgi:hypothetical protein